MKNKRNVLKEKELDWRKGEILKIARAVFAHKGFHRATMDDVAREVGISKGALYLCFASKESLLRAMIDQAITSRRDSLGAIFDSAIDSQKKIKAYVEYSLDSFESDRDLITMIMMLERDVLCSDLHKEVHAKGIEMMIGVMTMLTNIMKQGIKEGTLKKGDPDKMATALGGMVQMFTMRALFNNIKMSHKKEAEFIINTFLNGVKKERNS
jgi:AcrR family transcriptional regulator